MAQKKRHPPPPPPPPLTKQILVKAFSLTSADLLRASRTDPESVFQGSSQRSLAYCRGRAPSGERPFCTSDVMPRNSPRCVRSCARKRIYTVGGNETKPYRNTYSARSMRTGSGCARSRPFPASTHLNHVTVDVSVPRLHLESGNETPTLKKSVHSHVIKRPQLPRQHVFTAMNMENIHLAPEGDNDDLYSGYDYNDPMIDVSYS